jgi:hypothetical protein
VLDPRHSGVPGGPGRVYQRVYGLHQLWREVRQHFDERSCVLYRMFQRLFHEIRLDRRNLFRAMRLSKLFEVLSRAVKRLPGHLRDRASESFDRFGCRGYSIECDIDNRAIAASAGGFCLRALFSHFFLLAVEIIHQIVVIITHVCALRNKKFVVYPTKNWTKLPPSVPCGCRIDHKSIL